MGKVETQNIICEFNDTIDIQNFQVIEREGYHVVVIDHYGKEEDDDVAEYEVQLKISHSTRVCTFKLIINTCQFYFSNYGPTFLSPSKNP